MGEGEGDGNGDGGGGMVDRQIDKQIDRQINVETEIRKIIGTGKWKQNIKEVNRNIDKNANVYL